MTRNSHRLAVAVMSFDRPDYLERVLQTVVAQRSTCNRPVDIFLFQDGAYASRTNQQVADIDKLTASEAVFRRYIPGGTPFTSVVNLGVALNFDRAERTLFEEYGYGAALFLEDDLVLQPDYFRLIEALLDATAGRQDIGMVTAWGYAPQTPLHEQYQRRREVRIMEEHNWAFAMTAEAWAARDRVLQPYLARLRQIDYRERDRGLSKLQLHAMQRAFSRYGRGYLTSQDSMKNMAFEVLGRHRITTYTTNARYIGREGLHSTADKFAAKGYGRTVIYSGEHDGFDIPSSQELKRMRLGLQYR